MQLWGEGETDVGSRAVWKLQGCTGCVVGSYTSKPHLADYAGVGCDLRLGLPNDATAQRETHYLVLPIYYTSILYYLYTLLVYYTTYILYYIFYTTYIRTILAWLARSSHLTAGEQLDGMV